MPTGSRMYQIGPNIMKIYIKKSDARREYKLECLPESAAIIKNFKM
jgi:hypothetical protein